MRPASGNTLSVVGNGTILAGGRGTAIRLPELSATHHFRAKATKNCGREERRAIGDTQRTTGRR